MFFTLRNFYILLSLSLSIHFNCSWNFVSLWLWGALDLNFFAFVFMEFCWFVAVGCLDLSFFVFFFFADFHVFFFFLCCQIYMAKKNHEIFVIRFSFSLFFWLCNFYWIFGFLGFFYLISILGLFCLIYSVIVVFIYIGFHFL